MNHGTDRPTQGRPRSGRTRAGFTLIELLVIILIIGLLMGIMAPALALYKRRVMDNLSTITFRQLDAAVLLYREDFQDFPPSRDTNYKKPDGMNPGSPWRGSQLLALFLTGYGPDPDGPDGARKGQPGGQLNLDDGCEGYGFRVLWRGKVYGPYNDAHKAPMRGQYHHPDGPDYKVPRFFVDAYDNPILYYRKHASGYDANDNGWITIQSGGSANPALTHWPTPGPFRRLSGYDCTGNIDNYARDTTLPSGTYLRMDFALISAGANKRWCASGQKVSSSDDLTNFFINR